MCQSSNNDAILLQENSNKLAILGTSIRIKFNVKKYRVVWYAWTSSPITEDYKINHSSLERKIELKNVGVLFDTGFILTLQITSVCKNCNFWKFYTRRKYCWSTCRYALLVWYAFCVCDYCDDKTEIQFLIYFVNQLSFVLLLYLLLSY